MRHKPRLHKIMANVEEILHAKALDIAYAESMSVSEYLRHLLIQDLMLRRKLTEEDLVGMALA